MGPATLLLALSFLSVLITVVPTVQAGFGCSSGPTCNALVGYVSPNRTTIVDIQTLFGVTDFQTLLSANSFPPSTPANRTVAANSTVVIPFPCRCSNGTGTSDDPPVYTVVKDDGLDHIATDVFGRLVTFQEIQAANNIPNPDQIEIGQELRIPLPCSCDNVNGSAVVHYGHVVESGSSTEEIAEEYGVSEKILLELNGITDPKSLQAGVVLDVPLRACTSVVREDSLDHPFLLSNGTYAYTANNCVMCQCHSANNWTLQCEQSGLNPSNGTCPSMECGSTGLSIGNFTSSTCNRTTCSYAGYTDQTIFTTLVPESTCSSPNNAPTNAPTNAPNNAPNYASKMALPSWRWNFVFIVSQLVLLYLHHYQ